MSQTSSSSSSSSYITAQELERVILDPTKRDKYLIIDVRSTDFVGGNLPNAINLTTDQFSTPTKIERIFERYIETRIDDLEGKGGGGGDRPTSSYSSSSSPPPPPSSSSGSKLTVVVHCMRSQTRGPYVAHLLQRHLSSSSSSSAAAASFLNPPRSHHERNQVEVKILRGGYQHWYRTFINSRKDLFENLERDEQEEEGEAGHDEKGPNDRKRQPQYWKDVVEAREGDREEAEDSRQLRESLRGT